MRTWMLATLLAACGGSPSVPAAPTTPAAAPAPAPAAEIRTIDPAGLKAEKDAGKVAVLVDVRTPEEYAAGHVPGAMNLPIDALGARMGELDAYKAGEIHVICQSGGRSRRASEALAAAGYHPVDVKGGTGGWIAAGYPTE